MNQALHLPAYPVTEGCIGGVTEFEHTQPWIYGLDNPYLHGIYAPTTLELNESGLHVEGEIPKDLQGSYFRNGPTRFISRKTATTPSMATAWSTPCRFVRARPRIATAMLRR